MKKLLSLVLTIVIAFSCFSVVLATPETRNAFDWIMCVDNDIASEVNHATKNTEYEGEKVVSAMWDGEYLGYNVVFDRQPEAMEFVAKTSLDASGKQSIWNQKNFYVYIDGTAEENKLATFTIKVLDDHFTTCTAEITKEIDINVPHTIYFSSPSGYSYANSYKKFRFTSGKDAVSAGTNTSKKINAYPFVAEESTIYNDANRISVNADHTFDYLMEAEGHIANNRIGGAGQGSIFAYDGIRFSKNPDFIEVALEIYDNKQPSGVEVYIDTLDAGPVVTLTSKTLYAQTLTAELDVDLDLSKEHTIYLRQVHRGLNICSVEFFAAKDSDVLWPKPYDEAIITNPDVYNANYGKTYGIVETGGKNYYTYKYVYFPRAVKSFDVLYYNHNGGTGSKAIWLYLDGASNPTYEIAVPNLGNTTEEKVLYKNAPSAYKKTATMNTEIPAGYHSFKLWAANGVEVYGFDFEYADSPFDTIYAQKYDASLSSGANAKFGIHNNGLGDMMIAYTTAEDILAFSGYDFSEAPEFMRIRCGTFAGGNIGFNVYVGDDFENPVATFDVTAPEYATNNYPIDLYTPVLKEFTGKKDIYISFTYGDVNVYDIEFLEKGSGTYATEWNTVDGNTFKAIDFTGTNNLTNLEVDATGTFTVYLDSLANPIATDVTLEEAGMVKLDDGVDLTGITGLHSVRIKGATTLNKVRFADEKIAYNDDYSLDFYGFEEEYGAIIVVNEAGEIKIDRDYYVEEGTDYNMPLGEAFVGDSKELKVYFWSNVTTELTPMTEKRVVKIY